MLLNMSSHLSVRTCEQWQHGWLDPLGELRDEKWNFFYPPRSNALFSNYFEDLFILHQGRFTSGIMLQAAFKISNTSSIEPISLWNTGCCKNPSWYWPQYKTLGVALWHHQVCVVVCTHTIVFTKSCPHLYHPWPWGVRKLLPYPKFD